MREESMKKNSILSLVGLLFAGGMICVISKSCQKKGALTFKETLEQAGKPDQIEHSKQEIDQMENAKMVSEGSQFGVQYYNETAKEELEQLKKNK